MWLIDDEVVIKWKVSIFITFISSIWHSWFMTKWRGSPIVITMIFKWLKFIWYEHKQPYPPPTYIPTYLFTYPPTYVVIYYLFVYPPTHPPTYLSTHSLIYLPTHSPTCLLNQPNYLPTFYFISLTTYLPPAYHPTTCLLPTS
jgi:hypothetical protein